MITYTYDLDIQSGGVPLVINLKQYETDIQIIFNLYSSAGNFQVASGTTASIRGMKPDGNGISLDAIIVDAGKEVTVNINEQMTAVAGRSNYELVLTNGSNKTTITTSFVIVVERAALDKDTLPSDSVIREIIEIQDRTDEIIAAANRADEANVTNEALAKRAEKAAEDTAADLEQVNKKAQQIMQVTTNAEQLASEALDYAGQALNETATFKTDVDKILGDNEQLRLLLETKVDGAYVDDNGCLVLTSNSEPVGDPLGPFAGGGGGTGGGGTSGNNASLSVSNVTGWLATTIVSGNNCNVNILWSSIEDNMPTGNGTAKITVNGIVKAMLDVLQGTITIDLSKYVSVGSNIVKVNISDVYGNSRTINFSVQVVEISLSSSFDASQAFSSPISFTYTPVGSVAKTVYFELDGEVIGTVNTSVSNRQQSFTIPQQSHGRHTFRCYFECTINNQTVTSNVLYYELICLDKLSDEPIIVSGFSQTEVRQYANIVIPYTVYDPSNSIATIQLYDGNTLVSTLEVDRSTHSWSYRANTIGSVVLKIVCGSTTRTIAFTVVESDILVEAETDALALYLTSDGRSNNEEAAKRSQWTYGSISCALTGFNYGSDGWLQDEDGVTVLRVAGNARVSIPYKPFETDARTRGKTLEFEFTTRDVLDYDANIISCVSGGRGFSLTANEMLLSSEQSSISMKYKENEHIRASFVIDKRNEDRLLKCYINGILSGAVQYPYNDDFSQITPVNISIGSNDCTVDVYNIRIYDNNLNNQQIVNNWIADTTVIDDMLDRFQRNNIYDAYGKVVISQLKKDLPYLVVVGEELPQFKGDKKTLSGYFVDPTNPSRNFDFENSEWNVQGTSSQYYKRKNYKVKFKGGFKLSNGTVIDTWSMNSSAIPTKTYTFKADVASSEGCNNVELVRLYNNICPFKTRPQKANSKIRQGIDGFPMVIFWDNGTEVTFLGKYNFNNDKGTEEVYGFIDGDESWEILNNTSDRVLWKSDDFSNDSWQDDFEGRFPDMNTDTTKLQEFSTWVKSTESNVEKFKAEASEHLELESAIFYYLFTELFLMVDSRAKNAFPTTFIETTEGGQ